MLRDSIIRFAAFSGVLVAMALWEAATPRRPRSAPRAARWPGNIAVGAINALLEQVVLPIGAVGLAIVAQARGWGLLNWLGFRGWPAVVASVVALDLVIYLQHVMLHAIPVLWRIHRMHHTDVDFDTTTGVRFHPLEILLSFGIKLATVTALGPPAGGVLLFEVLLNATSMFNHSNVRIPDRIDTIVRWLVVTPDMHRVHHSVLPRETNSNFGFNLPWWDRLLGTYRAQPESGHEGMTIGIGQFRDPSELRLDNLLTQPFRGTTGIYPIARRAA